jgi:1-acyl-sn-glycerol-3-phosphate acyltransferase
MIFVRSLAFNVLFYATLVFLMILGLPCLLISRRAALRVVRLWARWSVGLLSLVCGIKVEFRNLELVPKGPSIIAVKHQSFLETFALILVLDDFSYILKKELMSIPLFGWYIRATEQIGIDRAKRGGVIAQLQTAVRQKLDAGRQVIIFPEGTRRPVGAPALYKTGISAFCTKSGVPCTPVALNTGLFWPRHSFRKRPGTVVIEFLPAIPSGLTKSEFMRRLQAAIEPATDALVAAALAVDPALERRLAKSRPATA